MLPNLRLFFSEEVEDLEEDGVDEGMSAGGLALPFCLEVTLPV